MRSLLILASLLTTAFADEAKFLKNTRQLTYEGRRSGEAYFHPDGKLLVLQSEREEGNPFYQIYLLNLLNGESTRVSSGAGKTTCAYFQPGTSRLLFASTHHDAQAKQKQEAELAFRASGKQRRYAWDYDEEMDIFASNNDGTQLVQLTKERGYDAEASYSPDGKQIVFCSLRSGYDHELTPEEKQRREKDPAWFGEIYIMNADGSNVRRLTNTPGYDGGPFFSPDGQRVIWRRFDANGMNADIYTMKLDGSDVRRLTDFHSMSWAPYYHPGGKYVVFTSNKLGFENFELFIVDADGTKEPVRVSSTDGFDGLPVFSPDGKRLCWTSNRTVDKQSQLFLADWDHNAALAALENATSRANAPAPAPANIVASAPDKLADLTRDILKGSTEWLAAPERDGRMTGTPGSKTAADWLVKALQDYKLKPLGGNSFLQPFEFRAGEKIIADKNALALLANGKRRSFVLETDYRPLAFTDNAEVEGEVIFAGYGLSVPEASGQPRYNSYDSLDVKDKIVLILRYVPEGVDAQRRAHLNRYAGLRYKVMMARERGAKGVLVATGPNSPGSGEVLKMTKDGSGADSGLPAVSISGAVADALLASSGKSLKELQTNLDTENPHAESGIPIPNTNVKIATAVEHLKKTDNNVISALPGQTDEWVVIGAHYDHLGRGGSSSMAKSGEEGKVHPGADDNASGVSVVLELAAALTSASGARPLDGTSAASSFRRGLIFALWSGEEMGLLGSAAFCANPSIPVEKIVAYVNFDMVGRLRDNKLTLQGVGSSKTWRRLIEKCNVPAGFSLTLQDDPYLPTDTTSFYPKRIPVLNFFTGAHEDYHRPSDTPEKLNYEGMERIARFAQGIITDLANAPERPDYSRVERTDQGGGSRETLRAYLGTIPDYTTEIKGVKISGVRGGSPAEKGGMLGGDVIVEFAGQKIANIYDYTYALDAVRIGQPVKIVVEREGRRVDVTVTPEARK